MRFTFGGQATDQAIQAPSANFGFVKALANQVGGTAWSLQVAGVQYTDLLVGGAAATTLTSDGNGFVLPVQGPDSVRAMWCDFGGARFLLKGLEVGFPVDVTAQIGGQVSTAVANVTGVANGLAQLDAVGRLVDSQIAATTLARLTALETTAPPAAPPGPSTTTFFSWPYSSGASNAMVSGNTTEVYEIPFAGLIATGPLLQLDDYSGTVATVVDIEKLNTSTSTWVSLYGASQPVVPTGQTLVKAAAPGTQAVAALDLVRMRLVTAPPTGTVGVTAASHPSTTGTVGYNDGATTVSTSHTVTMPSDGTTGDVVLLIVPNAVFGSLPSGWVTVSSLASTPTAKINLSVIAAPWAAGMANTFTLTTSAAMIATPVLARAVDITSIGQVVYSAGTEAIGSGAFSTPAFTAANDCDFIILFAAHHLPNAIDGYRQTWASSGGPAGMVKTFDLLTARGSTSPDYGLGQGFASGVSAGASVAGQPITLTGGTGGLTATSFLSGAIAVKRSAGTHGPTRIKAQLTVKAT